VSTEKRLVTVTAVVMTEKTEGPEDIAESLEVTACAVLDCAARRRSGDTRPYMPIRYPLTRFEARSEPVPEGTQPELTAGQLRALLDEVTRELASQQDAYANSIREQAGLERL
jgi:hypothetical protein